MTTRPPVVAIDGPASAGKGTLARRLAGVLGLKHLDTGLLYRATGRLVLDRMGDPADASAAIAAAAVLREDDLARPDLRGPEADRASSLVAAVPEVRAALLAFQRRFAAQGAVLDGRDIGTVVCADAPVKLFVTASAAARAQRRWLELQGRGVSMALEQVEAELRARDAQDSGRGTAPLRPAEDAVLLDTTELGPDDVLARALGIVSARLANA